MEVKMDEARRKRIKRLVDKLKQDREKVVGKPEITGVTHPKRAKPTKDKRKEKERRDRERRGAEATGPRGGQYRISPSGQKIYENRREGVRKTLVDYFNEIEVIDTFINKFKHFKGLQ